MTDRELQLALDACRPGSNDLAAPEFAALAERVANDPAVRREYEESQQFGRQLQGALHDVSIPADLAEKLLAALPAPRLAPVVAAAVAVAPTASLTAQADKKALPWSKSRRNLLACLGAACVAIVAVPAVYFSLPSPQWSHDEVVAGAAEWFDIAWQQDAWNEDLAAAPLARYGVQNVGVRAEIGGWQEVSTPLDSQTLLVQLKVGGKDRAALAVMRVNGPIAGLATLPPWTPQVNSGGRTLGVWQQDSYVYVLMVEGNPQLYRRLLPSNTIAHARTAVVKFAG